MPSSSSQAGCPLVLEVQLLVLVLNGGKVVRTVVVAPEVKQHRGRHRRQGNFAPSGLAVAPHDEHLLAVQAGQHGRHARLHVARHGVLQRLIALVGAVSFQEKVGRGNFAGPEFFDNRFLLKLVAKVNQFKVNRVEAAGKLGRVAGRGRLVQQRELALGPALHQIGRKQVAQELVLEERVNNLKRFGRRYFHRRPREGAS
jgi:hypothetical protein